MIAFTSDRISQPMVYIMNSDGSNVRRLTRRLNAYEDSPCWSPRGDRIAFVVLFDRSFDIATCSPYGDDTVILTAGQGSNENPRWSPDGLRIIFTSTRDGGKNLPLDHRPVPCWEVEITLIRPIFLPSGTCELMSKVSITFGILFESLTRSPT